MRCQERVAQQSAEAKPRAKGEHSNLLAAAPPPEEAILAEAAMQELIREEEAKEREQEAAKGKSVAAKDVLAAPFGCRS